MRRTASSAVRDWYGAESGKTPWSNHDHRLNTSLDDLQPEHAVKSFTQHLEVTHQGPQVTWIVFDEQVQGTPSKVTPSSRSTRRAIRRWHRWTPGRS